MSDVIARALAGEKGLKCPCCKRPIEKRPRKLSTSIANCLLALYRKVQGRPGIFVWVRDVKDPRFYYTGGERALLWRWGLAEHHPDERGQWAITQKGVDFVERRITVPRVIYQLLNETVGQSVETISIDETLGDPFDLEELLSGTVEPLND